MNDWLSGVEKFSAELRRTNELESRVRHPETERERMARVLRELGQSTGRLIEIIDALMRDEFVPIEFAIKFENVRENLSDDAKEIVEDE